MERMAWKGRIKHGCKEEYIRRHREIWSEMVAVPLKKLEFTIILSLPMVKNSSATMNAKKELLLLRKFRPRVRWLIAGTHTWPIFWS